MRLGMMLQEAMPVVWAALRLSPRFAEYTVQDAGGVASRPKPTPAKTPIGEGVADLDLAAQPPAVILMAGLQGIGKTTTTAKLAKHLIEKRRKKVLTVSADVYRPAAIEQLKTVTAQAGATWFPSAPEQKPIDIALAALDHAKRHYFDVLLVDTAGRLAR